MDRLDLCPRNSQRAGARWRAVGLWLGCLAAAGGTARPARGADRSADFVAALRQAGWDDTAVQFLDWAERGPLASDAFRRQIPFHRAVSLSTQGRQSRQRDEQRRLLARAADDFRRYAESDAAGPLAADALRRAANLYAEQALATIDAARRLPAAARSGREAAFQDARQQFAQARELVAALLDVCKRQLAALPKGSAADADPAAVKRRDELRTRQVEGRFLAGIISFETARTFDRDSGEFRTALAEAGEQFGSLHEQFRDAVVGASSRFYQGRCFQEQGEYQKALGCYKDLTSLPAAAPEFRSWTARAYRHTVECLLAQGNVDEAVRSGSRWLESSRPSERAQAPWLEVSYRLAEALQRQAGEAPEKPKSKNLQNEARDLLAEVAATPNEFQREARLALASFGRAARSPSELRTFDDALAAGREAFDVMTSSQAAQRLAEANNPDAVAELQRQAGDSRVAARQALELALELADGQTPAEGLNAARYLLAWLYWEDGRVDEAAVLAEFVARHYPESEYAASAAQVALAALEKIDNATRGSRPGDAAMFPGAALAELAQFAAAQWPSSEAGSAAINVLISLALRERRLEQAEKLLGSLPAESRASAELRLGSALWSQSLKQAGDRTGEPSAEAAALRARATELLASGFKAARSAGPATAVTSYAGLYLAQSLLAGDDARGALQVLEDPALGPLTLAKQGSQAASEPRFVEETYKTALRALLSLDPPDTARAEEVMTALESSAGADGAAAEQLTRVYAGLGLELQRELQELSAAGRSVQARQVAEAFRTVMGRVASRPDGGNWQIAKWVGETNLQIAQGLPPAEAKPYLEQSRTSLESVLAAARAPGEKGPDAAAVLAVHKRLGDCLLALEEYQKGLMHYAEALKAKPMMLDVQQAAAAGLQAWGARMKNQPTLDQALNGALPQPDGKNLIWGWLRLANVAENARRQAAGSADPQVAARAERYREVFFDARCNVVRTRLIGASIAAPDNRRAQLESARQNIASMQTLYPDLGGPQWRPKFEALLKETQREMQK